MAAISRRNLQDLQLDGRVVAQPLGKVPRGYLVLTPSHVIVFVTSDTRSFGTSVADKAALLDTMVGWSGMYRIEGSKIIGSVDASLSEVWNGKEQARHWTLSGNRLTLKGDPKPFPHNPSKTSVVIQV